MLGEYFISQLRIVSSGLYLVTYLDVGNFCDKSTETTLHEICVQVFIRFSNTSQPKQSVSLIYELAWLAGSVNLRKTCSKLHVRFLLWPKFPTYFDDVTTIENNRQVSLNIDATFIYIVAIFHIQFCCCLTIFWHLFGLFLVYQDIMSGEL